MFFILSEPVVPPLIKTALTHSCVWSLEILKWAKNFSFVIYLKCVSADHFKWSGVVLLASSPASDPVFVAALAQKWSRHCFLLNLSFSQQLSHSSDAQIKLSSSNTILQQEQRDQSSSHCLFTESLQGLFYFSSHCWWCFPSFPCWWVFLKPGKNVSSQSRWCRETLWLTRAFILCFGTCCKSQCMGDSS